MAASIYRRRRDGTPVAQLDPRLVGDIPADWETVSYVLGVIPDPDDPTRPMAMWIPISAIVAEPAGGGYGVNYGGSYG